MDAMSFRSSEINPNSKTNKDNIFVPFSVLSVSISWIEKVRVDYRLTGREDDPMFQCKMRKLIKPGMCRCVRSHPVTGLSVGLFDVCPDLLIVGRSGPLTDAEITVIGDIRQY